MDTRILDTPLLYGFWYTIVGFSSIAILWGLLVFPVVGTGLYNKEETKQLTGAAIVAILCGSVTLLLGTWLLPIALSILCLLVGFLIWKFCKGVQRSWQAFMR